VSIFKYTFRSIALYGKNNEESNKSLNNHQNKVDAATSPDITQRIVTLD